MSSASIPVALDEAREEGLIGPGSLILLAAFGAGFTWSGMTIRL
jgi:3-oxoacyl-[acyl-carrier-protein] synthase-3